MGLHELGPPAVPFVLAKLAREDPRYGTGRRYRELWRKMPPPIRRVLPKPADANFDELRACSLLLEIGPQIIPALAESCKTEILRCGRRAPTHSDYFESRTETSELLTLD